MMKMLNKSSVLLISLFVAMSLCGCSFSSSTPNVEPELERVRSICELATLRCYYHNVAKSEKLKGEGFTHLFEKDKEFWVEYDGTVTVGIDMSKVRMDITKNGEENVVRVYVPEAEILDTGINQDSYSSESFIESSDSINRNKITAEDVAMAVQAAQDNMEQTASENNAIFVNAQDRAKDMIKRYILNIGEATGISYKVEFVEEQI